MVAVMTMPQIPVEHIEPTATDTGPADPEQPSEAVELHPDTGSAPHDHEHDYVVQDDGRLLCECGATTWADGSDLALPHPDERFPESVELLTPPEEDA